MLEHIACERDDRDADQNSQPVQDLLVAQNRNRPAYDFQHRDLEHGSATAAGVTLPGECGEFEVSYQVRREFVTGTSNSKAALQTIFARASLIPKLASELAQ
jgi:hypothetical protein